jgi:hypothetical protein
VRHYTLRLFIPSDCSSSLIWATLAEVSPARSPRLSQPSLRTKRKLFVATQLREEECYGILRNSTGDNALRVNRASRIAPLK